ncbi:MAG TPA: sigma-54-dependent Fis family transcriptional regulator [Bacteroidales bacterium]|nr:sigma-54-dependent Fis family transcriptional regulator [Bacteroidales bacterium]
MDIQSVKQRFSIIGNAPELNRAIDIAVQVAPTDLSVLITGESGVGKESFPQIIHQFSHRKHGSYIAVNCGAIPEGTIDSELFGHEKGSFTGALADRKGYFEVADGGTIFLDEVGELPLSTQARLLRVLESGEFIRVGSSKIQKTNVRIVAATNLNMMEAVNNNRFREDLYYRLNTVPISIPPLRDRADDILRLFRKFALDFAEKYRMPVIQLTEDAKSLLVNYRWPGNVRQLKNITEQISIIEQQRDISAAVLQGYLPDANYEKMPMLYAGDNTDHRTFSSEREILYQVLFDMKKDMNELKLLVNDIMKKNGQDAPMTHEKDFTTYPPFIQTDVTPKEYRPMAAPNIQDTEEYIEESFSLEDMEKEAIRKALDRNGGKRKSAAADLNISERTLYRKIKEYNLE